MGEEETQNVELIAASGAGTNLYCLIKKQDQESEQDTKKCFTSFMSQDKAIYEYNALNSDNKGELLAHICRPSIPMYNKFGFRVIAMISTLSTSTLGNLSISIVVSPSNNIYLHFHNYYFPYTNQAQKYEELCFSIKSIKSYEQFKAGKRSKDELRIQTEFVKECVKKFLSHQFDTNKPPVTLNEDSEGLTLLEEAIDDYIKNCFDPNAERVADLIQRIKTNNPIYKITKCTNEIKKASDNSYMLATSVANLFFVSCVSLAIAISSRYFILKPPINILHLKFALFAASSVFAFSALCLAIKFALVSRSMIKNNILQQKLYLEKLLVKDQFYVKNSTPNTSTSNTSTPNASTPNASTPNASTSCDKTYEYLKQLNQDIIILSLNFKAYAGKKLSNKELEIKKKYLKDSKYSTKTNFLTTLYIYFFAIATIPAMSLFYYFGEVAKAPQSLKIVGYVCLSLTCISAIATVALYTESIVRCLSEIKENQTTEQYPTGNTPLLNKNNDTNSLLEFTCDVLEQFENGLYNGG